MEWEPNNLESAEESARLVLAAFDVETHHSAVTSRLFLGHLVLRVWLQTYTDQHNTLLLLFIIINKW